MKKILSLLTVGVFMLGLSSCDNKTKEKVINGGVISGTSSYLSSPPAASMTMLYKVAFMGSGAGDFSYTAGAPALKGPRRTASADGGLGTPNADGTYTLEDDEMGMTVTLNFKKSNQTVFMALSNLISGTGLCLYDGETLTATKTILNESFNPLAVSWPQHIPALWSWAANAQPIDWFDLADASALATLETGLNTWITGTAAFPDTIVNTVNGTVAGALVNLSMTTAMSSGMPTDAAPQSMTGGGTITFDTGAVWTVTCALSIGAEGPIGGTQTFTSTTGESGSLTFNADGSMDGAMAMNGVNIATIHINADGTGTYTDLTTGTEYDITDAMPS